MNSIQNNNLRLKRQRKARTKGWVHQPTEMVVGGWGAECHGHRWITQGLILLSRHLADSTVAFFLHHLHSSLLMIIDWPFSPISVVPASGSDIEMPPTRTRSSLCCVHMCLRVSLLCTCLRGCRGDAVTPWNKWVSYVVPLRVDPSALYGAEPEARAQLTVWS